MTKLSVNQIILRAASLQKKGELAQARALYQSILKTFPNNQRAKTALAKLELPIAKASARSVHPPKEHVDTLSALYNQGRFSDVVTRSKQLARQFPSSFLVWSFLGAASARSGQNALAAEAYKKAAKLNPNDPTIFFSLGVALQELGKTDGAIASYQRALQLKPDHADTHNNLGNVFKDQGRLDEALGAYKRALECKPNHVGTLSNIGNALKEQDQLDEAIAVYQRALAIKPDHADAIFNMGNALQGQSKFDEAILAYQRALVIRPDFADAYYNLGNALKAVQNLGKAIEALQRALAIRPDFADAHNGLGNALQEQGKLDAAIVAFQRALAINPDNAETYSNLGNALTEQRKLDEAVSAYRRALEIDPSLVGTEVQLIHQLQHMCDWSQIGQYKESYSRLGVTTGPVAPFAMLSAEDDAERQIARSRNFAADKFKGASGVIMAAPQARPEKLRIGYFSADFHNFPGMYLMAGLLEQHDRSKFEVFAFSYGPDKSDEMRERITRAVDRFIDVRTCSDQEVYALTREYGIDIAIHRNGYTSKSRTELFHCRVAPIQINYLGYPSSLGADFIDYIVADPVVIPDHQRPHYSENVIYLPDSYQPNDDTREIAQTHSCRADFGLPDDAFVFCCFNNNYKISPREFDIWIRLLLKIEGSVLWLLKSNSWAEQNLRKEAQVRGVDPSRLVFAEKLAHSEHLARHKHADLFVDTFNYNAHTTASDALWSGLPIVTKQGEQFAARVAASLLHAIGLPELIAGDDEGYETLIHALATQPDKLMAIKQKLANNRLSRPLFDTKRYTLNFELGLLQAYDLYFDGMEPQDIRVGADEI